MKLKARKIAARRAAGEEIQAAVARRAPQTVEDVSIGLGVRARLRRAALMALTVASEWKPAEWKKAA